MGIIDIEDHLKKRSDLVYRLMKFINETDIDLAENVRVSEVEEAIDLLYKKSYVNKEKKEN